MQDRSRVAGHLVDGLANEVSKLYWDQKRASKGAHPDMENCIIVVIKRHGIDKVSKVLADECLRAIASNLGKRSQLKRKRQIAEGFVPTPRKVSAPSAKPKRFSELLPFKTGNVWHRPMSA